MRDRGLCAALAQRVQAEVIGVDVAAHLLQHAAAQSPHQRLRWVLGQAEALPLADEMVDRALMSLVLHQIAHRQQALQEVYRVLRPGGCVLVRTVAPEVALKAWVPFRFFPKVAQVEAARLPAIDVILTLCQQAGFRELHTQVVCRNARLDLHKVNEELRQRKRPSYRLLTDAELENGVRLIEQEWHAKAGQWIDPKPHVFITAVK